MALLSITTFFSRLLIFGEDADLLVTVEREESGDLKGDLNGFETAMVCRICGCSLLLGVRLFEDNFFGSD